MFPEYKAERSVEDIDPVVAVVGAQVGFWLKTGPSIYLHLRDGGGEDLPDEAGEPGPAWAPGAQDGVLIYHWGGQADEEEVRRLSVHATSRTCSRNVIRPVPATAPHPAANARPRGSVRDR
ncbi:hypothetical protein ACTWPT_53185 [Nonomuraea sp. 3N208]|uniref:hypothetical protein n=1 Tax=Nonomuraea sp. 3N208 TaxID=3457421 RepID=UPI003FD0A7FD